MARAPSVASLHPSMALPRGGGKYFWLLNLGKIQLFLLSLPELAWLQKAYILLGSLPLRERGCPAEKTRDSPGMPVQESSPGIELGNALVHGEELHPAMPVSFSIKALFWLPSWLTHLNWWGENAYHLLDPLNPRKSHIRKAQISFQIVCAFQKKHWSLTSSWEITSKLLDYPAW